MKIEKVKLSQVKLNTANPRTITGDKFAKLINSILVFPKMMEIRPVVIDNAYKALAGNMRTQALNAIKSMDLETIQNRLDTLKDYIKLPVEQKKALVKFWSEWLEEPVTYIIKADSLSAAEKEQFIIKDNVSFGAWDFDALANKFDNAALNDWGMDVWQMPTATPMGGYTPVVNTQEYPTAPEGDEVDEVDDIQLGLEEALNNVNQNSLVTQVKRCQPYTTDLFNDILQSIDRCASIGVHGMIFEGLKCIVKKEGMIHKGNEYVYSSNLLKKHFKVFKERLHQHDMKFYSGENRLRYMGDSLCCCGVEDMGWRVNIANLNHYLFDKDNFKYTDKMREKGTAVAFNSLLQSAGISSVLRQSSYKDLMDMVSRSAGSVNELLQDHQKIKL